MALQAGVASTSEVLILAGAGLTGSIILSSGRLSELTAQLQELLEGVDEVQISPYKYDSALLAAQGLSFSDVMFVTKQNMANVVATVSKQLENVSETLSSTKRHLTKRLENLDWKMEEQLETSKLIANDVDEMKTNLSQIGYDVETIHQMISGLEGKLELLENKLDATNSGLWYLCQLAGGFKARSGAKVFQDVGAKLANHSAVRYEERSLKGLGLIAEAELDMVDKPVEHEKQNYLDSLPSKKIKPMKMRIHRSYPVGAIFDKGVDRRMVLKN